MQGDVIKSFLVGLGFGIDDASYAKFNNAIATATKRVAALAGIVELSAGGIAAGIAEVSKSFEQMGYEYHIIAPAINKALILRQELLKSYRLAGINIQKVVKDSIKLNLSLDKTKFAFQAIYKSVASRFFERITKQSDLFRDKIYANLPKIQRALESFVNFTFRALDWTNILGARLWSILGRVYDFFVLLHDKTNGWSTTVLALVAAWKFLNLSFLATPLGRLLALGVAILELYDDLKTFQEGGKSLINWGSETTKVITGLITVVGGLALAVWGVVRAVEAYRAALALVKAVQLAVFATNPFVLWAAGISAVVALLGALYYKWESIKKAFSSGGLSEVISGAGRFLSGVGGNVLGAIGGAPLGSNGGNTSSVNQNLNQVTNVNVQGVADAQGVGHVVSGAARENFDAVRDLIGSVRSGGQFSTPIGGR